MNSTSRIAALAAAVSLSAAIVGCGNMTSAEKGTVGGAAIGGVAGSVLSGGSTAGTVGGAAVGGIIGHERGEKKDEGR